MILLGKKVRLRPVQLADAAMLWRWINNSKVLRFLSTIPPKTVAKEKDWIKKVQKSKTSYSFVIERLDTQEPIGVMTLSNIEKRHRRASTGSFIAYPKYWGKGYGTDAKMVLLKFAFTKLSLHRVWTQVFVTNPRSRRYNEKCGYKYEGLRRQHSFVRGKYKDDWMLGVLKSDWVKVAKKMGYI